MSDLSPPGFAEKINRYFVDLVRQQSEAGKAFLFLEFVRDVFKSIDTDYLEKLYPQIEKHIKMKSKTIVVRGRVDAFLGNLIIEFKKEIKESSLNDAKDELKRYVSILWTLQKDRRIQYLVLAADGGVFVIFRPRTSIVEGRKVEPDEVYLDEVDRVNLREVSVGHAFLWLDRYMLYHTLKPATSELFSSEFGLNMPAYNEVSELLKESWRNTREETLYDQWSSFLRVVYGSDVDSEELFFKHTYLATLAKLLAYASLSGGALPVSDDQLREILEGRVFSEKWGVHNFLEEDFFSWVARDAKGLTAARMVIERLASYDLSSVNEDILKSLYQDLVDPEARHDLGEYYTPDWLAEYIVDTVLTKKNTGSVLDPACGSGTFLAASIRKKILALEKNMDSPSLLRHILSTVQGVDVHPLAVILARTTYLISLGTRLLSSRTGAISIPVYMANSIQLPDEHVEILHGIECFRIKADGKYLRVPRAIAENPELTDVSVEMLRDSARAMANGEVQDEVSFTNHLLSHLPAFAKNPKTKEVALILYESAEVMSSLIRKNRDTVWTFILKNIYKPVFLKNSKFDFLVGNPPWIVYNSIQSVDYQKFLKNLITKTYALLDSSRVELVTHMELATLFFSRCMDLYLKKDGIIGFVMPRSLLMGDQHELFRSGKCLPNFTLLQIHDLENVEPLFRVPACVITARKGGGTAYPVEGFVVNGELRTKNDRLIDAKHDLQFQKEEFYLCQIGIRTFIGNHDIKKITDLIRAAARSDYYDDFHQGATIVPRSFWLVKVAKHPVFGVDKSMPYLETSDRAEQRAKEDYEDVRLQGRVESRFLYAIVTGSELLPFGHLPLVPAVLPIEAYRQGYRILVSSEAGQRGFKGLQDWLKKVESSWKEIREEKAQKENVYQWLDYRKKLTSQNRKAKYRVVYPGPSSTYMVSCVLDSSENHAVKVDGSIISLKGPVVDHALIAIELEDEDEAHYLCAILNSKLVDTLIKPMQSSGQYGPRNIHKKVLELPIPRYNKNNAAHRELAALSRECHDKVLTRVKELEENYRSLGTIRSKLKKELRLEIAKIDLITKKVLVSMGKNIRTLGSFSD